MKKRLLTSGLLLSSVVVSPLVSGQDSSATVTEEDPFKASITLGYVGTSGNTETQTLNGEFRATWLTDNWQHNLQIEGLGSTEDNETTAERYYLEEKSDYNLTERHYLYAKGSYNDDRFSGYNYQASGSVGYGRYLIRNETFVLEGFLGGGYRQSEQEGALDASGEGVISIGQELEWSISENASLYQGFRTESGNDLTVSTFEIGLEANIIESLATNIAFQARYNSEVPASRTKTDTQTSVSLVYRF